jgi:ribosomal protein S27AE
MMNLKCSKCGSAKVIPLVGMIDQGQGSDGTLMARVGYTNPEAWVFKGSVYAKLKANICGECGYTELVAENPGALYEAYLRTEEHGA